LEQLGQADSPLGVYRLHGDRHCQLRRAGTKGRDASALGDLLAAAPARIAVVQRPVFVHASVFRQVAQWEESMKKASAGQAESASDLISKRIADLGDWRGKTLGRMRKRIKEADPDVVEEWKWVKTTKPGTPVWSHDGIICTGESYKQAVKLTFAKGALLKDPARLFNSSLDGNVRRAIDIHEGEDVDESAFKALVRQAVALNSSGKSKSSKKKK
jgi:hypothetical protein